MASTLDFLVKEALELPAAQRADLAQILWDSVEENESPVSPAWEAEIHRRISEIDAGTAVLIPGDQVFAEMRAKYPGH